MTYLFIVSHVDDAELSSAGWIHKLKTTGHYVKVISLSHWYSGKDLSGEFYNAMTVLGVDHQHMNVTTRRFSAYENYLTDVCYDKTRGFEHVVTHSEKDRHTDHSIVGRIVKRVYDGSLYTFLHPWNGFHEDNYFVSLSEDDFKTKLDALKCYKSQAGRYYMSEEFIRAQAVYNGIKCGKRYAEAFRIERYIE